MTILKLEDLNVWQEARELMKQIYEVTRTFPSEEKFNLVKHLKECARNIPGNIAEGFGRYNYQESIQFYRIARGSLSEIKSDIYCSFDASYIDEKIKNKILEKIEIVNKMLNSLISKTKIIKAFNYKIT
jgi:four helix bundle protein